MLVCVKTNAQGGSSLLKQIFEAALSLLPVDISAAILAFFDSFISNSAVAPILASAASFYESSGTVVLVGLLIISILVCLNPGSLGGLLRILVSGGAGYAIAITFAPEGMFGLSPVIFAAVAAVLSVILSKPLSTLLYLGGTGYLVYTLAFAGQLFPDTLGYMQGNAPLSLVAAGVALAIAILTIRIVRPLSTSVIGAAFASAAIFALFGLAELIGSFAMPAYGISVAILALIGYFGYLKRKAKKKSK